MAMASSRRVLHLQATVVPDGDEFVARCLELDGLIARGVDVAEAVDRLGELVARHLTQLPTPPRPRHAMVVPFEVAASAGDAGGPAADLLALLGVPP
jgi:predicted RNase H-like HicB family nuclease